MKEIVLALVCLAVLAQSANAFDGRKWNVSTGNLSVNFAQASPVGAISKPGYVMDPPPSVESLIEMKKQGLVAFEDYVTWGAVEREPGKWNWAQHDMVCDAIKKAGLEYVVYTWVHFPPAWLREASGERTLMRCVEHKKDTLYLSIFDPKTIEYYDHFYKNLSEHFGDKIDAVYACILGPYGEGNYPLNVPDFIYMGHIHEGYWCQDPYGLSAFRDAMRKKYGDIAKLNKAWGIEAKSFSEIRPPKVAEEGFVPARLDAHKTAEDRRYWLDFVTWYHQAIIDFTEKSIQVTLKYFPKEKVRSKPGGNAGGVNPIAWGTYSPGYAKVAGRYGTVLQPADCKGACFGDKWVGTAYQFYGVTLSTEPSGGLDKIGFTQRMFSDASCGASQLFTYEFMEHTKEIQKYIHLYTGKMGDTDVALLCPTTLYRLGGDLYPTLYGAEQIRDITDYDVLDELLIHDGALTKKQYRVVMMTQGAYVEQSILDKLEKWVKNGGMLVVMSPEPVKNVRGVEWPLSEGNQSDKQVVTSTHGKGSVIRFSTEKLDSDFFKFFTQTMLPFLKTDDTPDGVWTTRRGDQIMMINRNDKPVKVKVDGQEIEIPAHEIYFTND